MASIEAPCEGAIQVLSAGNNNINKDVTVTYEKVPQNEKETEMEVDSSIGVLSAQNVPLTFTNKPHMNSELQHYFSLFYKEMLWPSSNIVLYELALPGSVSFPLDLKRLFPIVILHQDKRSKCSVVELLHTIVTLSLGKKSIDLCLNRHWFLAMVKIGCESNDAVGNFVQQFIMQIVHYLSSKSTSDMRVPMEFLEMLFQCINCESAVIIKNYVSMCIKEFLQCLLNLLPRTDRQNSAIYHYTVHKIINLATYPSYVEPLTAAYTFNHLFSLCISPYLNMIAPNKYWLEFLHSFLMNLEKCNEEQVLTALRHIKDTICSRTSIFNAKFPSRRKPSEFSSEKLEGAVTWLFEQCCSVSPLLRSKCMSLFEDLCEHVSNIKSTKDFVEKYGIKNVNKLALEGLQDFEHLSLENLKALARTLEFYTWMFKKNMSTPQAILAVDKNDKEKFLSVLENFISIVVGDDVNDTVNAVMDVEEAKKILVLINKIVLKIFAFVESILVETNIKHVMKYTWNENLCLLISRFTLCPWKLGFSEQNLKNVAPDILEKFFPTVSEHLPCAYISKFQKNFFLDTQEELQNFSNAQVVISKKDDLSNLKYFLNGITRLKSCDFINFEKQLKFTVAYIKEKITGIFETLKSAAVNSIAKEDIDPCVIEFFDSLLNFFLLSYKPELVEFIINLISSEYSSTNGTPATTFFDTFKQPILEFLMKNPVETLDILNKILLSSPEKLLLLLESLLMHATNNPNENSKLLAGSIIKDSSSYKDLILDVQYHDWLFKINRLAVSLVANDSTMAEPLTSYVMEEFDKAENAVKRNEIVDAFVGCVVDGPESHVSTMFQKLREERSQAPKQLNALVDKLAAMKSWPIWEGIILLTRGACSNFFKDINLDKHLETYFGSLSSKDASKTIESIYAIFKDADSSPEERLDVLDHFLLPSIENCHNIAALGQFYEDNFQELHDLIAVELNDSCVNLRKHGLIDKIAGFRLFELMYGKLPTNVIISYRVEPSPNSNDPVEYLNVFLLKSSHEVRSFECDEKELARLLHCSALNVYVALASLQQPDSPFQNVMFKEVPASNQLVWRKIVDCERKYEFRETPSTRFRIVNVIRKNGERTMLSLEDDELNDHECMGMIVGIFLHMHDCRLVLTRDSLPDWMVHFHEAFGTEEENVILFLLRVIVNARRAFLPCMHFFFESVAKATCSYIQKNKINYLVRDVLLMIVEAKCELRSEAEIEVGEKLITTLMSQAQDPNVYVCEYNIEVIEKLVVLWKPTLRVAASLETLITQDEALAIRIIHMLLKNDVQREIIANKKEVQAIVKRRIFRWREPLTPQIVQIWGYLVSCIPEEQEEEKENTEVTEEEEKETNRDRKVKYCLVPLFKEMTRACSADFCVRMFKSVFDCCPSIASYPEMIQFMDPSDLKNDECKAECFEIFLETMTHCEPSDVLGLLEALDFMDILSDKTIIPCVEVGFKVIEKLLGILDAEQLLPYARVAEKYSRKDVLAEHRGNAVYFFTNVYKKYVHVTPEESDEHTETLMTLSEQVIINGVSDPWDEVQEDMLDFWRDRLTENTVDRLKRILDMFSLEVHSSYAQFLCLMMLDLTNKYKGNQKQLFGPLTPCNFENQETTVVPRKSRSKAPVQRVAPGPKSKSPTNVDDTARRRIDNTDMILSRRTFPSNEEYDDRAFFYPVVTRNYAEEYEEKLKAHKLEQENSMKFNRTYKESYLPDVEITQADVVATMEDYARRCPRYAADLSVSIVCGMLDHFRGKKTYDEILEKVTDVCSKALEEPNEFASTALEILYRCGCPFDADDVLRISKAMDLQSLGILVLEKKAISYDYNDLYRTNKKIVRELPTNVHLAMLYRSIDEPDVVDSIFKNWRLDTDFDYLREGSTAEVEMDWSNAREAYEEGFNATSGVVQDYCMEGMFECLSKLSSWSEINKTIDSIVNEAECNSIWQHPNKEQLLPWIFKAQLQEQLENLVCGRDSESEFSKQIEAWLKEKGDLITKPFGEELSLFFLCNGDSTTARKCLDSVLECMQEKDSNQRVCAKFKRIKEIEMYMKAVDKDPVDGAKELINFWEKNVPEFGDDLLNWSVQLNYRLTFANLFGNWLKDVSMDSGIANDLVEVSLKQRQLVNDLALRYKNTKVARKYSVQIKKDLSNTNSEDERYRELHHQFKLDSARYGFLIETDVDQRFTNLVSSWNGAIRLYKDATLGASLRVKVNRHIFEITRSLRDWVLANDEVAHRAKDDDFVIEELKVGRPEDIEQALFDYSFNTLKETYQEGSDEDKAESYAKFAEYCLKLLRDNYDRDDLLHKEIISSLLQAMSFGSTRGARYFPCLLKESIYRDNESLSRLFSEWCQAVPTRMFLDWQEEIISNLATPLLPLVLPIVKRLCNDFPSAVIITLWNARSNPVAKELYAMIFTDQKCETFFSAMEYLCQPEEYLRHRLQEFMHSLCDNESLADAVKLMLSKVATNNVLHSPAFKKVLTNYKKEFEKFTNISDVAVARNTAEQLCEALRKSMAQRMEKNDLTESTKLAYYSPFLNDFTERDFHVDVPTGNNVQQQKPKIVRIDRFVRILPSKSSSLVIKIVGSNGQTYEFLVKCGLDLRQDQKLQRMFKMANESLKEDLNCCIRNLSIGTYNVVPISNLTGLVQWVPNVKSLEEIVDLSLADKSIIHTAKEKYQEWINAASEDEATSESQAYKHALDKYSAENVSEKMIELSAGIKPNLIQQSFLQISPSLDSYFKLRQNFIKSYATMCLTHWLFGVGDRRLKNILVDIFNGDCFGINFGLVLGAAADLPIPELVPFRLTAQIINLMKPFGERDLFGATMCHVLKALKNSDNLIIGCLDAFLEEPVNWNAKLNLLWKNDDVTHNGVQWSPLNKIEILKQKLRGWKPSVILTNELSYAHSHAQFLSLYKLIVNGNERYHTTARSLMKDSELTPEEQVLCLLDQATDVNTVGRMWADWKCFL